MTKLDLSGNEIGVGGVKHLLNLLQDNLTITELVIIFLFMSTWDYSELNGFVFKNISKNFIGSGGVQYICEIFRRNRVLKDVDLSGTFLQINS